MLRIILFLLFSCIAEVGLAQSLVTYASLKDNSDLGSDLYLVYVIQNGIRKSSFVYKSVAGTGTTREWGRQQNNSFHFTTFSFSGVVTVEVVKLKSKALSATIRPNRLGIGKVKANYLNMQSKVRFKLVKAAKVSIEFSDDPDHKNALVIFADTLENKEDIPVLQKDIFYPTSFSDLLTMPKTASVVYFKPGIYDIGYWDIPTSVKQVYVAGGAYVKGYLHRSSATIKINGRGILSNYGYNFHYPLTAASGENYKSWYKTIEIEGGTNHVIEGITLVDGTSYNIVAGGKNILIKNVKIHGFRFNNDGISINGVNNTISDTFIRSNDDAITTSVGSNLKIFNCSFWQLQGSTIQLGWTAASKSSINISNCDIMHDEAISSDGNVGFINAMNYTSPTRGAIISDVKVSDIYFDTPILRFLDIRGDRSFRLADYASSKGEAAWTYQNFYFNNIFFNGKKGVAPLIYLHGFNEKVPLSNFIFKNLFMNNIKVPRNTIMDKKFLNFKNVDGIQIK
ncbi:MAG: hypothetical protein EOO90_22110 [Pedobacter sp.]|nr:MAG: hypothetical protein EOO90_22110 [Pedobacter sp.]